MIGAENEVETIAQAFYDVQDCARGWDQEPELLKERFRNDARAVIAALHEYRNDESRGMEAPPETQPFCPGAPVGICMAGGVWTDVPVGGELLSNSLQPKRAHSHENPDRSDATSLFTSEAASDERGRERRHAPAQSKRDAAIEACSTAVQAAAKLTARSREQIQHSKALVAQSLALLQSQNPFSFGMARSEPLLP